MGKLMAGQFGGSDLRVGGYDGFLTSPGYTSFSNYSDTTGKGEPTFTGGSRFTAAEVEVWQVPMGE